MRSSRLNKRALEMSDDDQSWPKKQEVEELDVPGNKAVAQPKAADAEPKTADWVSDLIKQTVQFLTQHKDEADLSQKIESLPIARKLGPTALQGPVSQFQQSGNSSALAGELELLLQGKRTISSKAAGQEAPNETEAPTKPATENEQPEAFKDPKRPEPSEDTEPEPSADNTESSDTHRRVQLDTVEHGGSAPTTFAVDNTREQPHKAGKRATPTAWSIDNTREQPSEEEDLTTEQQIEQKKNATYEILTPKTAGEVDFIVEASAQWVGKRLNTGTFRGGTPSFIVASNGDEPIAVVSAHGDCFDASGKLTNRFAKLLKSAGFAVPDEAPSSNHVAAEGGASEEEETEEETSVDSTVVQLLEACKTEWTNLGDPVNPSTWPKEIERAILNLNDELVAAIQKVEDKLVEGEFYSKNVDEGVGGMGGSSLDGLNVAPPEVGAEPAPDTDMGLESDAASELDEEVDKLSSKEASIKTSTELPDTTSTETRKALKHTQGLKDDIASKFFEFKKVVQDANDSSLVKNVGETLISLKVKLEEVEKILGKQLTVLESAETAIDDKKKNSAKKAGEVPEAFKKNWKKPADGEKKDEEPKEADEESKEAGERKKEKVAKTTKCVKCDKSGKVEDMRSNPDGAGYMCRPSCGPWPKKEATRKTANCPTCGATVMQNGAETNGIPCPNCAAKANTAPKTPIGTTPQAPQKPGVPQNGPVSPSPIKQYGGPTASLKNLVVAGGE